MIGRLVMKDYVAVLGDDLAWHCEGRPGTEMVLNARHPYSGAGGSRSVWGSAWSHLIRVAEQLGGRAELAEENKARIPHYYEQTGERPPGGREGDAASA